MWAGAEVSTAGAAVIAAIVATGVGAEVMEAVEAAVILEVEAFWTSPGFEFFSTEPLIAGADFKEVSGVAAGFIMVVGVSALLILLPPQAGKSTVAAPKRATNNKI